MEEVKEKKTMVIRWCQKQFNFKLNINNVCQLYLQIQEILSATDLT